MLVRKFISFFPQFRNEHRHNHSRNHTHIIISSNTRKTHPPLFFLRKRGRSGGTEDLLVADLGRAVGQREGEVLGEELSDVGALDVVGLLDLDNAEDLKGLVSFKKSR